MHACSNITIHVSATCLYVYINLGAPSCNYMMFSML